MLYQSVVDIQLAAAAAVEIYVAHILVMWLYIANYDVGGLLSQCCLI